jgi:eukaryotic-like serine/threonine-protein kinase
MSRSSFALAALFFYTTASQGFSISTEEPAMFRGNAAHEARSVTAKPVLDTPTTLWKIRLPGRIFASPVISGETLYLGSGDNRFQALDAKTGKLLWSFTTLGAVHSSAAIAEGIVTFGDSRGIFYAVDAATGVERWRCEFFGERQVGAVGLGWGEPRNKFQTDECDFFLSSPVCGDGMVYYGSGNGNVYALDLKTGAQRWRFVTNDVVHCAPAIASGRLYFGSWDGGFYCVEAATGKLVWRAQGGLDPEHFNQVGFQSSPMVHDGIVYVGCRDSHLYAFNAEDGAILWKKHHGGSWIVTSPILAGGLLCYSTSDTRVFLAVDPKSGKTHYEFPIGGWGFSSPVAVGNLVYFGSFNGTLFGVDPLAREVRWTFQTDEAQQDPNDIIKEDGSWDAEKIFANFDRDNLPQIMRVMFSAGAILSSPAAHRDMLIFATADGWVYAVR